jgi:hypothetical protein
MDDGLQQQIRTYQHRLDHLLQDGQDLHSSLLTADRDLGRDLDVMRQWQRECAATISQLSGGSKQHWLSRAYSDAFLPRLPSRPGSSEPPGAAVEEAPVDLIVNRILGVLREAQASLHGMAVDGQPPAPAPAPRRFEFVHDPDLRPRLEEAFAAGQTALDRGDFGEAVLAWASTLEAILTDALRHHHGGTPDGALAGAGAPLAEWPFEARIEAAEQSRLISSGCARLPATARRYREGADEVDESGGAGIVLAASERDARLTGQVLRLIMRDLTPGR